jgi:hypothetical protein
MIALPVLFVIYASDRRREGFLHGYILPDFGTDMLCSQHRLVLILHTEPQAIQSLLRTDALSSQHSG